jgi:hypothetical protein
MVNLFQLQEDTPTQIGWVTLQSYSGKWYVTKSPGWLRYWREEFELDEIVAFIGAKNSGSVSIARK